MLYEADKLLKKEIPFPVIRIHPRIYAEGFDEGAKSILSQLTPIDQEWKDRPDSEGSWWFTGKRLRYDGYWEYYIVPSYFIIYKKHNGYIVEIDDPHDRLDYFQGKWQKALIPEVPKEE